MPTLIRLFLLIVICGCATTTHAASFDCKKASVENEHLICSESQLSRMDEQYSAMYQYLLAETKGDSIKYNAIKSAAVNAYKSRENNCDDIRCLRRWYQNGIERMSQRLWQINPTLMQKKVTPKILYEQLNILSFNNMDNQRARHVNKRYLVDIYPSSSVTIMGDQLRIRHEDSIFNIRIVNENTIEIHNRIINATYNSTHSETIYYDPVVKEFRAGMPGHCNLDSQGSKLDFAKLDSLQHLSHGEIDLFAKVDPFSMPIYNKPNGTQNGTLSIEVEYKIDERLQEAFTFPSIRICDSNFDTLIEPAFVLRTKYLGNLLYFDKRGDWLNLSSEPRTQVWIKISDLPKALTNKVVSRESVFLNGSNITVRSAHRLRAEPNTSSDILHVIDNTNREARLEIEPLEIKGDWLKVNISASIHMYKAEPKQDKNLTGWIKWRERPGKEYVFVEYYSY